MTARGGLDLAPPETLQTWQTLRSTQLGTGALKPSPRCQSCRARRTTRAPGCQPRGVPARLSRRAVRLLGCLRRGGVSPGYLSSGRPRARALRAGRDRHRDDPRRQAYLREETRVRTQSGREARDLIERLIRGQPIADQRRHPAAPGLDPTGPLVTIVGRIDETTLPVGDALQVARDALEEDMSLGKVSPSWRPARERSSSLPPEAHRSTSAQAFRTARQRTLDERRGADRRPGTSPLGQRARPSPRMAAPTVPTRGALARARRERLARGSHPLSRGGLIDASDQGVMRTATSYFVTEERCPGVSPAGIAFSVSSPCL